jgi:hypothetical protein
MERRDSVGFPYLYTELVRRGGGGRRAGVGTGGDAAGRNEASGEEPSRGWPNEGEGLGFAGRVPLRGKYRWTCDGSLGPRPNMREMHGPLAGYAVVGPWVKLVVVSWAFSPLPLFFKLRQKMSETRKAFDN